MKNPALTKSPGNTKLTLLLLVCLSALLIAGYFYIQSDSGKNNRTLLFGSKPQSKLEVRQPTDSIEPTPLALPTGKQVYRFSHGQDVKGPRPESITIDPLSPQPGETQTVTIKINADTPAKSAAIELITDNKSTRHELTAKNDDWQGSWQIDDTYDSQLGLRLILVNDNTYDQTMWIKN